MAPSRHSQEMQRVALVAHSRRALLLRVHAHRLAREDLEDCYAQATLELIARARAGYVFCDHRHIANALELRLLSRVRDFRRNACVRAGTEAALARGVTLGGRRGEAPAEPVDARADVERLALAREQLRSVRRRSRGLTAEQRLVLLSQLAGRADCAQFCAEHGWSPDKYRKVAQRARARLRDESAVR